MKKQNFSTLVKRSIFSLGFAGFLFVGVASAATQDSVQSSDPVISYAGNMDGQPVFKVNFENENGSPYFLTIRDDQGQILYSAKIKDKQFSKTFRFESDRENAKLTFVLTGNKETQTKEFKVNTSTRVLNDVMVTSL